MRALFIKEFNGLKPFLVLIILIYGMDFLFIPLTEYPDQSLLTDALDTLSIDAWEMGPLIMAFLTLSCSSGLLVGEVDQGTIRFLDGLPTTRNRIFIAKVLTAYAVLFFGPIVEVMSSLVFQHLSRTSLSPGYYWELVGASLFLQGCQIFIFLSFAVLCSFLRRFGWILAALSIVMYLALGRVWPGIAILNPASITRPDLIGHHWRIPWEALSIQLPIAVCLMIFSKLLFCGGGLTFTNKLGALKNHLPGRIIMGCSSVLVVVLWIGVFFWITMQGDEPEAGEQAVSWEAWQTVRIHTDHYLFAIPEYLQERAAPMIERSNEIHNTVTRFLDVEPLTDILVDGSTAAGVDYAGLAFWKTIRLSVPTIEDPVQLEATLGHETTHVYIEILSKKRMGQAFRWTRFFHEGLAEYVEQRFFEDGDELDGLRFHAALAFSREEARMEDLLDSQRLSSKYDTFLVYPLGERFITALIDRYGDDAPSRILKAIGRENAPKELAGSDFWRDAFQHASFNFDETVNDYYQLLDREQALFQDRIDAIPRLYGAVEVKDGWIAIKPALSFSSDVLLTCRVRQNESTPMDQYGYPIQDKDGVFWIKKGDYPSLQFQLGVHLEGGMVYEPWADGNL